MHIDLELFTQQALSDKNDSIIFSLGISCMVARPKFLGQRSVEAKFVVSFLLGQMAYLLLVFIDNEKGSELWQFLALTYIPLTVFLFVILLIVSMTRAVKLSGLPSFVLSLVLPILYLTGAFLVLRIWGWSFNFPL